MAQVETCYNIMMEDDYGICAMPIEVWYILLSSFINIFEVININISFVIMLILRLRYWIISFLEAKDMLLISALSKSLKHLPDDDVLWKVFNIITLK